MRKKGAVFILVALMVLLLVSCITPDPRSYDGSHPELYVVAIHSLLGVWGGLREDTLILEEDAFGRVMFAYLGGTEATDANINDSILAILIAQRTTEHHSYFYQGINFVMLEMQERHRRLPASASAFFNEDFVMRHFTEKQIERLKSENSWNKPLDADRFFRVPVSRRRKSRYMTYVPEEAQQEAYRAVAGGGQLGHPAQSVPLTMDKNGNVIFFMRGRRHDRELQTQVHYPAFLFIFDVDGNLIEDTGVMELTDLWDYREQLREFKEANGWSFYYR